MHKGYLAIVMTSLFFLTACVDSVLVERGKDAATPIVRQAPAAPQGDAQSTEIIEAVLYLPDQDHTRLITRTELVNARAGESSAYAVIEALLGSLTPLFSDLEGQQLKLSQADSAIEITGDIAVVNLGVSMRLLSAREQFEVRASIANTLCEAAGISYVNVLVNGREDGADIASTIPNGLFTVMPADELNARWRQTENQPVINQEVTKRAALYYPAAGCNLLLAEAREVTVASQDATDDFRTALISAVLGELAAPSETRPGLVRSAMPPLDANFMVAPPKVYTPSGSADRLIQLSFRSEIYDYITVNGVSREMFFASVAYTLIGFVPGIDGVVIHVGGLPVTDALDADGQAVSYENGRMSRADFPGFSAGLARLYLPSREGGGLVPVDHPVEQRFAGHPRTLLRLLIDGSAHESDAFESTIFPGVSLSDADIIGVEINGRTALVNVSQSFADACAALDTAQTKLMIYSIVNTLTRLRGVRSVRLYVQGEAHEFFGEPYSSLGEYFANPAVVVDGRD